MITALAPIVFMIIGALILALADNGKAQELGKAMFWAGAFALAFYLAAHPLRFG